MSEIPQATAHFIDTTVPSQMMPPPPPPFYQRDFSAATQFLAQNNWPVGLQRVSSFCDSMTTLNSLFLVYVSVIIVDLLLNSRDDQLMLPHFDHTGLCRKLL